MYSAQPTAKFRDSFVGKSEKSFTCKDIFLYRNDFKDINFFKLISKYYKLKLKISLKFMKMVVKFT